MVGTLQKLSLHGIAEVAVLADGEEIWSRQLGSGDSIRHGFDIVAYDLPQEAALDIIVTSDRGSEPVQVETIDGDEERFCRECLHGLRTRSARHYESICTIVE